MIGFLNLDDSGNIKNMELFDLNDINLYNEKINECKKSKKI
jgi:hypothetical protein